MDARKSLKLGIGCLGLAVLAGCYQYVPVGQTVPDRGKEIRAFLDPNQDIDVGDVTIRDVRFIEGFVFRATPDSLAVSSVWVHNNLGNRYATNGDVYYLRRQEDLGDVQIRKIHPAKTVVALVGTVAGGLGVFTFIADAGSGGDGDGGKGDVNPNIVGPVIR